MRNRNYKFIIYFLLSVHGYCFPLENGTHIAYDQKQSGQFNIHISIKDVDIVNVHSNEFIDETINDDDEYYYDEDDLTIKPLVPWTPSPPDTGVNYSVNTITEREQILQLNVTGNKANILDITKQNVIPSEDTQAESKESNIPLAVSKAAPRNKGTNKNIVLPRFNENWISNRNIDISSEKRFKKSSQCSGLHGNNNRNCRKKNQFVLIKSLLGLMQLLNG